MAQGAPGEARSRGHAEPAGLPGGRHAGRRAAATAYIRGRARRNRPHMKITVAIPVYNAERFLDDCLLSALDQTERPAEIIAVDDGSTDSSGEILDGYADRVRVFHKPNGGAATALNQIARAMRGDWFKWLSADDLLRPHCNEALAGEAARLGRDAAAGHVIYADYDVVDEQGTPILGMESNSADYRGLSAFERRVMLLYHCYCHGTASLFHRSAFGRCGYWDESIRPCEDYEFWLRLCLVHGYDMSYVADRVASVRKHPARLTDATAGLAFAKMDRKIKKRVAGMLPRGERSRYASALARCSPEPRHVLARRRLRDAALEWMPEPLSDRLASAYWRAKQCVRRRAAA